MYDSAIEPFDILFCRSAYFWACLHFDTAFIFACARVRVFDRCGLGRPFGSIRIFNVPAENDNDFVLR